MSEPHWIIAEAKEKSTGPAVAYALRFYKTAPDDEILDAAESEGFEEWVDQGPEFGGVHLYGDGEEPCNGMCPDVLWLAPGRDMDELRCALFVNACETLYKAGRK